MQGKRLSNLLNDLSIFSLVLAGVKAAFRDSKNTAHHHDGKFLLMLFNKLIFYLLSREKMLTASDRMSLFLDTPCTCTLCCQASASASTFCSSNQGCPNGSASW